MVPSLKRLRYLIFQEESGVEEGSKYGSVEVWCGVWWEGGEGERDRETNPQIFLKITGWALLKRENEISQIFARTAK